MIDSIQNFLSGKKTYIVGAMAVGVILSNFYGIIDTESANAILMILGFGGLITLRAGVSKTR